MKMQTYGANDMRTITQFVNDSNIKKEDIISVLQAADGTFLLSYFTED